MLDLEACRRGRILDLQSPETGGPRSVRGAISTQSGGGRESPLRGGREEDAMRKQWSVEEIVAALEAEVAVHRERNAHHAEQEAFHRDKRSHHEAALEAAARRLEEFRAISAAALEI